MMLKVFWEGAFATGFAVALFVLSDKIWKRRLISKGVKQSAPSLPSWRGIVPAGIIFITVASVYTIRTKQAPPDDLRIPALILLLGLSYFFDRCFIPIKQKKDE
jgi:hypothetical protein